VAVLRVPGGELYYEAENDGVAVVLVHGLALDARMWDDQVPALKDIARVVRYDVRGFGRSTRDADTSYSHADDLWRLLNHLEIDKAVLVGLSMGGRIVVEATLAAPERVRALVLLDAVLDGVPWDPDSERGIQAIGEGLRSGGLDEAKKAWLRHDFFIPAQRTPDVAPARGDGRRLLGRELDERGPARSASKQHRAAGDDRRAAQSHGPGRRAHGQHGGTGGGEPAAARGGARPLACLRPSPPDRGRNLRGSSALGEVRPTRLLNR
jgi:pimeloyl-ACP methyl ester carboxylesterase